MLVLIIVIILVLFILINQKIERMDGNMAEGNNISQASTQTPGARGDCSQSLQDIKALIDAQKQEDQDAYDAAMKDWKNKKGDIEKKIAKDGALLKKVCGDGSCGDYSQFFSPMKYGDVWGNPTGQTPKRAAILYGSDLQSCMVASVNSPNIDYIVHDGTNCAFILPDYAGPGYESYKTPTGMRKAATQGASGSQLTGDSYHSWWSPQANQSEADCQASCLKSPSCYLSYSNNGGCLHGSFVATANQGYVKQANPVINLPDDNAYVIQQIGKKPSLIRTPIDSTIICQDCRQVLDKASTTDSTNVLMSQVNTCIANANKAQNSSSTPTSTPTSTLTPSPSMPSTNIPNSSTNSQSPTIDTSKQSNMGYIFGGVGSLIIIILLVIIMIMIAKK